jgi:1,2-diacylglycerol 3-alpha-glucosyltransferase
MSSLNIPTAIITIDKTVDITLFNELKQYCSIIFLEDIVTLPKLARRNGQLGVFLPLRRTAVESIMAKHGNILHAMGCFGLILAQRIFNTIPQTKISTAVYHQNEFLFKTPFFFENCIASYLKNLPAENIIFFNQFNRNQYSSHFNSRFAYSSIAPIGIDLPQDGKASILQQPGRVVSVGNLVNFKKYTRHTINAVANLRRLGFDISYDIYGDGPERPELEKLVDDLNIRDSVTFHGRIPYENFNMVVSQAMAFIGSGTAVVEAAALGIPSLIGIESVEQPVTYGYLHQIEGYSYNEWMPSRATYLIEDLLKGLLTDNNVGEIGKQCAKKAQEFSISKTIEVFLTTNLSLKSVKKASFATLMTTFLSFILIAIADIARLDKSFRNRRDQSLTTMKNT